MTRELDFQIRKTAWDQVRFVEGDEPAELQPGQVRFRVDRFAFTANNISYAMAGDMLRYWSFFPAEEGWGRLPTMGYGDVIASKHDEVAPGLRCFGFFPMSRYLVIEPESVAAHGISDGIAHRQGLAPAYNSYTPVDSEDDQAPEQEDAAALLRGLFMTSFLADDFLQENDRYGARRAVVVSASSKTAVALAHLLHAGGGVEVVGITSPRNADFVKGLGTYDRVVHYEDVASIAPGVPTVIVDMSGHGPVISALHRNLGSDLVYSCMIGGTHWDAGPREQDLPGPSPEFFFAPGQIQKRTAEWGPAVFQERLGAAWRGFRDGSDSWLQIERSAGREAVERVFRETLAGSTRPERGNILSLWD